MKRPMFVVASLFLLCAISFGQAARNQGCAFEQAASFDTATNLAQADYGRTVNGAMQTGNPFLLMQTIVQAFNDYKAKIQSAADSLPSPCWRELVTAENSLAQCLQPVQNAFAAAADPISSMAQRYAQTGDRQTYEADMRGVVRDMLGQVPRQCWFSPVTLPAQSDQAHCPQAWSEYSQCYQANQNVLAQGGNLQVCYRPLCNLDVGPPVKPDCQQKWSAYNQCQEEWKKCDVRTKGAGPCPACFRPPCPE